VSVSLSADQYRVLVEHAATMIWRSGRDAACDYFNPAWLEFTGRTLEQEGGWGWVEAVHPEDVERCVESYQAHFARQAAYEMEYRLRRHDGVYRWLLDRGAPYTDETGTFAGFIGSCIDIEDRRQADRAKATFIALIAHELRTPLTAVKAYLEVIRRRLRRGDELGDVVQRLDRQVERAADFARELGDAVALEAGRPLALRLGDVDLASLVGRVVEACRRTAAERRQRLQFERPAVPVRVQADAERLTQALGSVLDNALKFSPAGGEVRVTLDRDGRDHLLTVHDAGIGIPREEIDAVTRGYYRASNAPAAHYPGVGLGLAVCKAIVERHGGRLAIASAAGAGTTVSIALPAEVVPA
jgi:PAS domain S-box-containing protein